jgi:hypothetical protein
MAAIRPQAWQKFDPYRLATLCARREEILGLQKCLCQAVLMSMAQHGLQLLVIFRHAVGPIIIAKQSSCFSLQTTHHD